MQAKEACMSIFNLKTVFDDLSKGDLKNISLSDRHSELPNGEWDATAEAIITSHVNLALTDLHTRFPLKEKQLTLGLRSHITEYVLTSDHAVTNTDSSKEKYILDSYFYPFNDTVLKVVRCFDDTGQELPMNNESRPYGVFTSSFNALHLVNPEEDTVLFVMYRANHPKLNSVVNPETEEIDLISSLYEALLFYVAHRVYRGINSAETQALSLQFYQLYEGACSRAGAQGLLNVNTTMDNNHLDCNGWV